MGLDFMLMKYYMFLGLKKTLPLVVTLEDKGYWVIFKDRKALLWAKGSHLSTT
jgi:hypothetical protein